MSNDKAPVSEVKHALSTIYRYNENTDAYTLSVDTFELLYGRKYVGKEDRGELERIKWHAKRLLAGQSGEWGGKRDGAGHRKQATEQEVSE